MLPGHHHLSINLSATRLSSLTLMAESYAEVVCSNMSGLKLSDIDTVYIRHTIFNGCGTNQLYRISSLLIENSTFVGHTNTPTALDIRYNTLAKMVNCFIGNYTSGTEVLNILSPHELIHGGGAIVLAHSAVKVVASSFQSNSAQHGGAIYSYRAEIVILNSTFTHNSATNGGAILAAYSYLSISLCTVDSNTAIVSGGFIDMLGTNRIVVRYTIFIANQCPSVLRTYESSVLNITRCVFINNSHELHYKESEVSTPGLANLNGTKHCRSYSINSSVSSSLLGMIYVAINSILNIIDTTFMDNTVPEGVINSLVSEVNIYGTLIVHNNMAINCIIYMEFSTAKFVGYTSILNNTGPICALKSSVQFYGRTEVSQTSTNPKTTSIFMLGGGFTSYQSHVTFTGFTRMVENKADRNGGAILTIDSEITILDYAVIANNSAICMGGGIYIYAGKLNLVGIGNGTFIVSGNAATEDGGGIFALSTFIVLNPGCLHVSDNSAHLGGGLYLMGTTKLQMVQTPLTTSANFTNDSRLEVLKLEIDGNKANYGGGVYIDDSTNFGICENRSRSPINECFMATISFQPSVTSSLNSSFFGVESELDPNTIVFRENSAAISGSSLYGGLLDRCSVSPFVLRYTDENPATFEHGYSYFKHISIVKDDDIRSAPVQLCFCEADLPDCYHNPGPIYVKKGYKFNVSLVAVDHVGHPIDALIHISPLTGTSGLGEGQLTQSSTQECTNLTFNIFSLNNSSEQLILYAEGPCKDAGISQTRINVIFSPCTCPIGFQPNPLQETRCQCECDPILSPHISNCNVTLESFMRETDFWISYSNSSGSQLDGGTFIIYPHCPFDFCHPSSPPIIINLNYPEGADAQCMFNRTGLLCGACHGRFSLVLGSSRCKLCSNHFLVLIMPFLLAGIVLVVLILIFNLTTAVGTINGLILYANIVVANREIFLPFSKPNFATVFMAWLNLDLGLETCFFNGMDAYAKSWLQLSFPLYVIFLVIVIIMTSHYSTQFAKLLVGKDPVATLATLILLSYTKLLRVIITALSFGVLEYSNGTYERVWLFDANINYLKGKHVALFAVSLLIIIVGIAYMVLLLSWQCLLRSRWVRDVRFISFMDTYHAPYNTKHRYWTGLLLLVRVVLYLVSALNLFGDPRINLLSVTFAISVLFFIRVHIQGGVYRHVPVNFPESLFTLNLAAFAGTSMYTLNNTDHQAKLAYISVAFSCFLFLCVTVYHAYAYVLKKLYSPVLEGRWYIIIH